MKAAEPARRFISTELQFINTENGTEKVPFAAIKDMVQYYEKSAQNRIFKIF